MKQLLSCFLLLCFVVSQPLFANTIFLGKRTFSDVQQAQRFIEEVIQIDQRTIDEAIPYALIYNVLQQGCNTTILQDTQTTIQSLQAYRTNGISTRMLPTRMLKYFSLLQKMIHSVATEDTQLFCKQKYLLYSLLEYSQQQYQGKEMNTPKTSPSQTTPTTAETEHSSAQTQQPPSTQQYLTLKNHNEQLTNENDLLLSNTAEKTIQKEIGILIEKQILNEKDLQQLDGKIEIKYIPTCGSTKGSYHMTQKVGGTDRKLKAILLNINLCEEASYLKNFLKYVRQIFIHELAHYLYYFKDYAPEQFDNICWKNENNLCDTNDFISTYAQKSKEEDYAESFAYRYLGYLNNKEQEHMSAYPPKMEKKQQHFDEIYA